VEASSYSPRFKEKNSSVGNYRPEVIVSNISKVFGFILHDQISHFIKSKLNFSKYGFIKYKHNVTNLITFLDLVSPLICSQDQIDSFNLDFSNTFDILSRAMLLQNLSKYELSSGYLN
jgi:hypothetical protein